jgi:AraC-like DNA-binding protein
MRTSRKPRAVILRSNPQLSILKQNCTDPRMHLALDLLAACDLKEELRTDHICKGLNLSTSRLRHLFHEQLGMSPAQVLKSLRMQAARNLLISTYMRTKEILTEVGLNDASHFVRDFKDVYGETPSQVRKQSGLHRKHGPKNDTEHAQRASA